MEKSVLNLSKKKLNYSYLLEVIVFSLMIMAAVIINWKMIRDGLNGMTDLRWHVTWLQHFYKHLSEGIWYPRWLDGTNYGYGSPTFVFYPPLVYYFGSILKFCGLNTENSIITLFSVALFLSGLNFYIFARNRWGIIVSFTGALAYMTAPYLARDIYFRGGLSSIFVQAWIPLLWWLTEKCGEQKGLSTKWQIGLAFTWIAIALTHTPSLLLCAIVWFFWILFLLPKYSSKSIVGVIIATGLGWGMASLYLLPAIFEKSFVSVKNMKEVYGGYKANLFWTPLPFPEHILKITHQMQNIFVHQALAIIVLAVIVLFFSRHNLKTQKDIKRWLVLAIALTFMMSYFSMPIWQSSSTLQMVQFPWRFLQIFSFVGAVILAMAMDTILKLKPQFRFILSLVVLSILLINFKYSYKLSRGLPGIHNPGRGIIPNVEYFKTALNNPYDNQLIDVVEYRPILKYTDSAPTPKIGQPQTSLVDGKATINVKYWDAYQKILDITAQTVSTIKLRTYYFPAWHLYVNDKLNKIDVAQDGTMQVELQPGKYKLEFCYQWTTAFKIGMVLSFLSFSALILFSSNLIKV